ncbi:aminodeoxychorismate lyase [Thalassotalea montiporae]
MSHSYVEIFQQPKQQNQQKISTSDRALAYGDGLFTTAKIADGKVLNLSAHIERLLSGVQRLAIDVELSGLKRRLAELAKDYPLAVLKVLISAGEGGRGYSRLGCSKGKVIISIHEFPVHYNTWHQQGINLGLAKTTLGVNPLLAGIKHLNRLEQVLVRQELDEREEDDVLVSNCLGHIIEASAGNVFWLTKQQASLATSGEKSSWLTPNLSMSGVDGLARQYLIQQLNKSDKYSVEIVEQKELVMSDINSMLVCNSVLGIAPVHEFAGSALSIAPVHQLQKEFTL